MSGFAAAHGVTPLVIPSMSRELSPRDAVTIWKLWRLMVRFRPDVVHTHTAKAGAVGRIAGLLYRVVSRPANVDSCTRSTGTFFTATTRDGRRDSFWPSSGCWRG